jgi:hypothetical protein
MKYYWLENSSGVCIHTGAGSKQVYKKTKGARLLYTTNKNERPKVGEKLE